MLDDAAVAAVVNFLFNQSWLVSVKNIFVDILVISASSTITKSVILLNLWTIVFNTIAYIAYCSIGAIHKAGNGKYCIVIIYTGIINISAHYLHYTFQVTAGLGAVDYFLNATWHIINTESKLFQLESEDSSWKIYQLVILKRDDLFHYRTHFRLQRSFNFLKVVIYIRCK